MLAKTPWIYTAAFLFLLIFHFIPNNCQDHFLDYINKSVLTTEEYIFIEEHLTITSTISWAIIISLHCLACQLRSILFLYCTL